MFEAKEFVQVVSNLSKKPMAAMASSIAIYGGSIAMTTSPSGNLTWLLNMAIEIVSFPSNSMVVFHSYVSLPEAKSSETTIQPPFFLGFSILLLVYQRKNQPLPPQLPSIHPLAMLGPGQQTQRRPGAWPRDAKGIYEKPIDSPR